MKQGSAGSSRYKHATRFAGALALARWTALLLGFAYSASAAEPGLLSIARASGFAACEKELGTLDRNLFGKSDFSVRAFTAEKTPSARPFSAIVDSRRAAPGGGYVRTLTHLSVAPAGRGESCAVSYEQTQYHELRCNDVQAQMAPKATPAAATSLGAVTLDLHRNMSLTLIPVGAAQCVTVLKEVSY